MLRMKKSFLATILVLATVFVSLGFGTGSIGAQASTKAIVLTNNVWNSDIYVCQGETVKVRTYLVKEFKPIKALYKDVQWEYTFGDGINASVTPAKNGLTAQITGLSVGSSVLSVTCTGVPKDDSTEVDELTGRATIYSSSVTVKTYPDVSGITAVQDSIGGTIPIGENYVLMRVDLNLPSEDLMYADIPVKIESDNSALGLYGYKQGDYVTVEAWGPGTGTATITIGNISLKVAVDVKKAGLNVATKLLAKGKSFKLTVNNVEEEYTMYSLQPDVVSCTPQGKIKALKQGNAVIVAATTDGRKMGCVVSVVPNKIKKIVEKGREIYETGTYSQDRRMQNGYYDCSSLTYKAYKSQGINLCGYTGYAPTSRDQARWCKNNNRFIKNAMSSKNVQNLKLLPGDLMFEYRTKGDLESIYHVEMIEGFIVNYFDDNGDPVIGVCYASKYPNAYCPGANQYVGRPYLDM